MTDEQLYKDVDDFVAASNQLVRGIRDGRGTLGKLTTDPRLADAATASLQNL